MPNQQRGIIIHSCNFPEPNNTPRAKTLFILFSHRANLSTREPAKKATPPSNLPWLLNITSNNLNLLRLYALPIIKFEINILDHKRPHLVAESIHVEMALYNTQTLISSIKKIAPSSLPNGKGCTCCIYLTLKVSRPLAFSASASATALSKRLTTRMASCGSIRPSSTSSSRVSTRVVPMLGEGSAMTFLSHFVGGWKIYTWLHDRSHSSALKPC